MEGKANQNALTWVAYRSGAVRILNVAIATIDAICEDINIIILYRTARYRKLFKHQLQSGKLSE